MDRNDIFNLSVSLGVGMGVGLLAKQLTNTDDVVDEQIARGRRGRPGARGEVGGLNEVALEAKAPFHSPIFSGDVRGISKDMVGLSNVDNTSDPDKPISTATSYILNELMLKTIQFDASGNLLNKPVDDQHITNKKYVDSQSIKKRVQLATCTNFVNCTEIDGESIKYGDKVLLKDQIDQTKNGIYIQTANGLLRDPSVDMKTSLFVYVTSGEHNKNRVFFYGCQRDFILGQSAILFIELSVTGKVYSKDEIDMLLSSFVSDDVYSKDEIDMLLSSFVSDDVYSKEEVDVLLSSFMSDDVYSKEEVDVLLSSFMSDDVYTKQEIDELLPTSFSGNMNADIIPIENSTFSIGTPDKLIKELYISNNSIYFGKKHKVSIIDDKFSVKKYKVEQIPASILEKIMQDLSDGIERNEEQLREDITKEILEQFNLSIADMTVANWEIYGNQKDIVKEDVFNSDDADDEVDFLKLIKDLTGFTETGQLNNDPSDNMDPVTKQYVDNNFLSLNEFQVEEQIQFNQSIIGDVSGNASTATKLQTPVTIGNSNFDGTSSVTLSSSDLTDIDSLATKEYVEEINQKIVELVSDAPETLDTLKELSDILTKNQDILTSKVSIIEDEDIIGRKTFTNGIQSSSIQVKDHDAHDNEYFLDLSIDGSNSTLMSKNFKIDSSNVTIKADNNIILQTPQAIFNQGVQIKENLHVEQALFSKNFFNYSDQRLKESIVDINKEDINKLMDLRGVSYKWKDQSDNDTDYGFVAQEVKEVFPNIVSLSGTSSNEMYAVEYVKLIPLMIEKIRDLENKLEMLKENKLEDAERE